MKNQIKINQTIKPFDKKIFIPSDKSLSIRCILLASIAVGKSKIYNILESEDVFHTLEAVKKIGIEYIKRRDFIEIYGLGINGFNLKNRIVAGLGGNYLKTIGNVLKCVDGGRGRCPGTSKYDLLQGIKKPLSEEQQSSIFSRAIDKGTSAIANINENLSDFEKLTIDILDKKSTSSSYMNKVQTPSKEEQINTCLRNIKNKITVITSSVPC